MRLVLLVMLAAVLLAPPAAAQTPAEQGKALFKADCSSCHTIGGGDKVGPDLKGVVERTGADATKRFVGAPDKEIASGDARIAALVKKFHNIAMPNFHLTADQVDALVAYLQSPGGAGATTGGTTPTTAGSPSSGKKLFTGATAFAHGGPACVSCHTIAGVGAFGGGKIGRDLTEAYSKFGGAPGIASLLTSIPFPRMQPIYAGHPLTKSEQADLAAFLGTSVGKKRPGDPVWTLVGLGLAVTAGCFALAFLVWPRRRLVVRRTIVPPPTLSGRS